MPNKEFYKNIEKLRVVTSSKPTMEHSLHLHHILKLGIEYERYLFSKLQPTSWFEYLHKWGYFSSKNAPDVIYVDSTKTEYSMPVWVILPYLEKVAQSVSVEGGRATAKLLISIIDEVTQSMRANKAAIQNNRTTLYFVKIIARFPNKFIPRRILRLIPTWLSQSRGFDIVGTELAKNLLPRFIKEGATKIDLQKAELIVNGLLLYNWRITDADDRIIGNAEELRTYVDPYWLGELIRSDLFKKIGESCSLGFAFQMAIRLREVLEYRCKLHLEYLEVNNSPFDLYAHFDGKKLKLSYFVPKDDFRDSAILAHRFLEKPASGDIYIDELTSPEINNQSAFLKWMGVVVGAINNRHKTNIGFDREALINSYNSFFMDHSKIWLNSLMIRDRIGHSDPLETLALSIVSILLEKSKLDKTYASKAIRQFLSARYPYYLFKRIAILMIAENWKTHRNLFWQYFDKWDRLLMNDEHRDELRYLFENNASSFSLKDVTLLEAHILQGAKWQHKELGKKEEQRFNLMWYYNLRGHKKFRRLYEKYRNLTGAKAPPSERETTFRHIPDESPLSLEDIKDYSPQKLAGYFSKYQPSESWEGPSIHGLGKMVRLSVSNAPTKYIAELDRFILSPYAYVHQILDGFKDSWQSETDIDWQMILSFIGKYVNRKEFWANNFVIPRDEWNSDCNTFVSSVAELIKEGVYQDEKAFDEKHIPKAIDILSVFISKMIPAIEEPTSDPITTALNSTNGKILLMHLELSLRLARLEKDKNAQKRIYWDIKLKSLYVEALNKEISEAYTIIGWYMPNFLFLDKKWVMGKISELYEVNHSNKWEAFMYGYLFGGKVYHDLYKLMGKHYKKAIYWKCGFENYDEMLMGHIALGHLTNLEKVYTIELFEKVIEHWNEEQILKLISVLSKYKDDSVEPSGQKWAGIRDKIIDFWRVIYRKYYRKNDRHLSKLDRRILAESTRFLKFLPNLDKEKYSWIKLAIPHIWHHYAAYAFIKDLLGMKELTSDTKSARYAGRLLIQLQKHGGLDFDIEGVNTFVRALYEGQDKKLKATADEICNGLGIEGTYFLEEIYWEFNE